MQLNFLTVIIEHLSELNKLYFYTWCLDLVNLC